MIEGMLLGSILNNIEVSYNLTNSETKTLEKCHEMALKKLLALPSKSPRPMLYFLTRSIPVRFQIQRRRLVYLHHILNQNDESLLKTFFKKQMMTRKTKDWATTVLKDKGEYEIDLTLEEIQNIPVNQWKKTIKEKTTNIAISYLNNIVGTKSRTYK